MIRKDYILRMIEKCAQMLARIQAQIGAREYAEAGVTLDQAFQELIGAGPGAVSQLTETELLARLTRDDPTQVLREKALLLVALLEEAAQIRAAAHEDAESRACRLKALNLLLTLQLQDFDFELPGFVPRIELLRERLADAPLPLRTLAALWRHYEHIGAYALAEDALFELLESESNNQELVAEAKEFYKRLLRQSDYALESGNLPRAEVQAGLDGLGKPGGQDSAPERHDS